MPSQEKTQRTTNIPNTQQSRRVTDNAIAPAPVHDSTSNVNNNRPHAQGILETTPPTKNRKSSAAPSSSTIPCQRKSTQGNNITFLPCLLASKRTTHRRNSLTAKKSRMSQHQLGHLPRAKPERLHEPDPFVAHETQAISFFFLQQGCGGVD